MSESVVIMLDNIMEVKPSSIVVFVGGLMVLALSCALDWVGLVLEAVTIVYGIYSWRMEIRSATKGSFTALSGIILTVLALSATLAAMWNREGWSKWTVKSAPAVRYDQ